MKTTITLRKRDFLRWLGQQGAGRRFDYCDPNHCILASWLGEYHRLKSFKVGPYHITIRKVRKPLNEWMARVSSVACRINLSNDGHLGFSVQDFRKTYAA